MIAAADALQIDGLTVSYNTTPVLFDVRLRVPTGTLMGVVGPNGAGKSTLLKAVLGVIPSLSGVINIQGSRKTRGQIGYVPQRASVDWDFPTTVFDLVLMGTYGKLGWFRRPGKIQRDQAMEALRQVGMQDYADRQIGQLSGGQQQRAFLARAFVQDAPVYFMDEPFAGVDATTEKSIIELLKKLRSQGKTLLVVHHDLSTVPAYFDQVTLLNQKVIASGNVTDIFTADNLEKTFGKLQSGCLAAVTK